MLASLALLPVFAGAVFGQVGSAIPQSTSTPSATPTGCDTCYIVANIAQVIFADYTNTQTATAVASVGNGRNGTVVTTVYTQPLGSFSANTDGVIGGQPVTGSYIQLSGTEFTLNGATLTSPTAYNVFTQYTSFTKTVDASGSCVTSQVMVSSLAAASSFVIAPGAQSSEIFDAEMSFFSAIGKLTCIPGAVISTQIPVPVTTTTTTSTTTSLTRLSIMPAAATTTGSVAANTTSSGIVILTPTPSAIVTGAAPINLPHDYSSNLLAALFAIPGIAAWML